MSDTGREAETRCPCGLWWLRCRHQTAERCRRPDARRDALRREALHSEAEARAARVRRHFAAQDRAAKNRRERDETLRSLGLVKVRGALGGTYWE